MRHLLVLLALFSLPASVLAWDQNIDNGFIIESPTTTNVSNNEAKQTNSAYQGNAQTLKNENVEVRQVPSMAITSVGDCNGASGGLATGAFSFLIGSESDECYKLLAAKFAAHELNDMAAARKMWEQLDVVQEAYGLKKKPYQDTISGNIVYPR